jgi:hypothetical protein
MAMYIGFKDKGIEFAKQAVAEDEQGNYEKAWQLYCSSLEYFNAYLKYEKNDKLKASVMSKVGAPRGGDQREGAWKYRDGAMRGMAPCLCHAALPGWGHVRRLRQPVARTRCLHVPCTSMRPCARSARSTSTAPST